MRHNRKINHLGRRSDHRKAMLANMATSLIMHKKIKTTVAKAKALRTYVEPLITKSKEDSTHSRRIVFGYLQNKNAVSELFREISPKIMERPGGYTRILKIGNRAGDNAEMCIIELVDYNENLLTAKAEGAGKTGKRRRRGGGKKKEEVETRAPKKEAETQEPAEKTETSTAKKQPETKEESETGAAEEITDVQDQTDEVQETHDEVVDSAEEITPDDMPEAKDEIKPDDTKNDKKE
jgi:large subunit ribosomal protein L17